MMAAGGINPQRDAAIASSIKQAIEIVVTPLRYLALLVTLTGVVGSLVGHVLAFEFFGNQLSEFIIPLLKGCVVATIVSGFFISKETWLYGKARRGIDIAMATQNCPPFFIKLHSGLWIYAVLHFLISATVSWNDHPANPSVGNRIFSALAMCFYTMSALFVLDSIIRARRPPAAPGERPENGKSARRQEIKQRRKERRS